MHRFSACHFQVSQWKLHAQILNIQEVNGILLGKQSPYAMPVKAIQTITVFFTFQETFLQTLDQFLTYTKLSGDVSCREAVQRRLKTLTAPVVAS